MKVVGIWILAIVGVLLLSLTHSVDAQDIQTVVNVAQPSVAVILARMPGAISSGTGFLAADGVVLTARHVVAGASRILLKFPRYPPVEAHVMASDSNSDVAVLTIPSLPIRPLALGDIAEVRAGQTIVVIGFPLIQVLGAETSTVTEGIVSAVRPDILQIQAPVSPGNSGGPVLDLKGNVIGIVEATLRGGQQINFATPITAAKSLLPTQSFGATSPSPAPVAPPTPARPAPAPRPSDPFAIVAGQGIGPVKLGMSFQDVQSALGPPTHQVQQPDGSTEVDWYEPPTNRGIGVRITSAGTVDRIWVTNDSRFTTRTKLHIGSTEAEVRAAIGAPTRISVSTERGIKVLAYDDIGMWFFIQLSEKYTLYNQVFEIGIMSH